MRAAASKGDQRLNMRRLAVLDVRFAQVSVLRDDARGAAQLLRQPLELLDHRHELLFVVGRFGDFRHHGQHDVARHERLGVLTLIKAASDDFHDARLFMRQIDLVFVLHAASRWFGQATTRSFISAAPARRAQ